MSTLNDVQESISKQMLRDFSDIPVFGIETMCLCGLSEEVGEVLGLEKRHIRGYDKDRQRATRENLVEELGDVLWYLTAVCNIYDITLQEIWDVNVDKLEKRYGPTK